MMMIHNLFSSQGGVINSFSPSTHPAGAWRLARVLNHYFHLAIYYLLEFLYLLSQLPRFPSGE